MENEIEKIGQRISSMETELASLRSDFEGMQGATQRGVNAPKPSSETGVGAGTGATTGTSKNSQKRSSIKASLRKAFGLPAHGSFGRGDIEMILGGNLLGKLGILALVLAVVWFIKLAFDRRWVNESGRIAIGIMCGLILIGIGMRLAQKRIRILPYSLTGAGFASLYISWYGAFSFYDLIGKTETFAGLAILSLLLSFLAFRVNSQLLFSFSLSGIFLAPILLSSGENSYRFLFSYLTLFNVFYFIPGHKSRWRIAPILLLGTNSIIYLIWASQHMIQSGFFVPFLYLLLLFVGFQFRHYRLMTLGRLLKLDEYGLGIALQFFFAAAGYTLMELHYPRFSAHFLLSFAAINLAFYTAINGKTKAIFMQALERISDFFVREETESTEPRTSRQKILLHALVLILWQLWIISALTDFFEGALLSMSWIALAGSLTLFAAWSRNHRLVYFSLPIWTAALIRLIFFQGAPWQETPWPFMPIWNENFALFIMATALLGGAALLGRKHHLGHGLPQLFSVAAMAVLTVGSLKENHNYFIDASYRNLGYSYVLGFYALVFLLPGFIKSVPSLRYGGMALASLATLKLYTYDVWQLSKVVRIVSFLTLGAALVLLSFYYQSYFRKKIAGAGGGDNDEKIS